MDLSSYVRARISTSAFTAHERARAEAIFAALLPGELAGLPTIDTIDRARFWHILETAPAPSFGPGLRVMLRAFALLPLAYPGFRATFHALDEEARARFVEAVARDERYAVRQIVTTLKMLALFAYFDDDRVRARFDLRPEASR